MHQSIVTAWQRYTHSNDEVQSCGQNVYLTSLWVMCVSADGRRSVFSHCTMYNLYPVVTLLDENDHKPATVYSNYCLLHLSNWFPKMTDDIGRIAWHFSKHSENVCSHYVFVRIFIHVDLSLIRLLHRLINPVVRSMGNHW